MIRGVDKMKRSTILSTTGFSVTATRALVLRARVVRRRTVPRRKFKGWPGPPFNNRIAAESIPLELVGAYRCILLLLTRHT